MPCTDIVSYQYLIPVATLWTLLLGITVFHGIKNRESRQSSRGWQLYASIVVILAVLSVEAWLQLTLAAVYQGDVTVVRNALGYLRLFFCSLSDSLFIALLLAVAGGFCITRDALGPYKSKVIGIPSVYFTTDMVLQFVMVSTYNNEALLTSWERFTLALLLLLNLMALLLAWIYTFDLLGREIDELEVQAGENRNVQMAELGYGGTEGQTQAEAAGYATAPDQNNPQYSTMNGHDDDVETSFADKLALRDKITLMRRFRWAVVVYIIATAAVELLPVFLFAPAVNPEGDPVVASEGYLRILGTIIIMGHTVVLFMFLAGLAFIFRLRPNNPYLMLDEDGPGVVTGLGVLDDSPVATPPRASSPQPTTPARISASHDHQHDMVVMLPLPSKGKGMSFDGDERQPALQDSAMSVDKVLPNSLAPSFSLADDDDYAELGISRDATSPVTNSRAMTRGRTGSKDEKSE